MTEQQLLNYILPLPFLTNKSEMLKHGRVVVRIGGDGSRVAFKVTQQMMDVLGQIYYVVKSVLKDDEMKLSPDRTDSNASVPDNPQSLFVGDPIIPLGIFNKKDPYEVVVVSHPEIFGRKTAHWTHKNWMFSPKNKWDILELTEDDKSKRKTTKNSAATNIHTYHIGALREGIDKTFHQDEKSYPLKLIPRTYRYTKKDAFDHCKERFTIVRSSQFAQMLADQHRFLLKYRQLVFDMANVDNCPRNGWEQWPLAKRGERFYDFQILVLCLTTNSSPDDKCKEVVRAILKLYPDPFAICQDPQKAMDVLASKCKDYEPEDEEDEPLDVGMNFQKTKSLCIIIVAKQLVIRFIKMNDTYGWLSDKTVQELDQQYCLPPKRDGSFPGTWTVPLPPKWVAYVKLQDSTLIIPKEFDYDYFRGVKGATDHHVGLRGIGPKMANLVSEAVFGIPYGPAVDRHLIRLLVECNIVPAFATPDEIHVFMREVYAPNSLTVFTHMNEVPGMIGQIMRKEDIGGLKSDLFKKLIGSAAACGYGRLFPYYLRTYNPFKQPLDGTPCNVVVSPRRNKTVTDTASPSINDVATESDNGQPLTTDLDLNDLSPEDAKVVAEHNTALLNGDKSCGGPKGGCSICEVFCSPVENN